MSNLQLKPLKEILDELVQRGYVLEQKGKYKFTALFYEDLTGTRQGLVRTQSGELVVAEPSLPANMPEKIINWELAFVKFIAAAQVPERLNDNKGMPYYANKYSEAGMKVFRKIIEKEGVNIELLVQSTALYYKSSIAYKKTIGNYITDGDWRGDYQKLADAANTSEEAVIKHIQNEVKNESGYSPYTLG